MCIITDTVRSVSNTNIFTCATSCNTGQFVVYSNTVHTPSTKNAMILPVPNPHSVQFVNLSHYEKLFDDMNRSFKSMDAMHLTRSVVASAHLDSTPLRVYSVGSYLASIANSVEDLDRVDRRVFTFPDDVRSALAEKYKAPFGFIICRLKQGNHSYHPFAYAHDKDSTGLLFVPTYHIHPHDEYDTGTHESRADWDHTIYSVMTDKDSAYNDDLIFKGWSDIEIKKLPLFVWWVARHRLQRFRIQGYKSNEDLWLQNCHIAPKPKA